MFVDGSGQNEQSLERTFLPTMFHALKKYSVRNILSIDVSYVAWWFSPDIERTYWFLDVQHEVNSIYANMYMMWTNETVISHEGKKKALPIGTTTWENNIEDRVVNRFPRNGPVPTTPDKLSCCNSEAQQRVKQDDSFRCSGRHYRYRITTFKTDGNVFIGSLK